MYGRHILPVCYLGRRASSAPLRVNVTEEPGPWARPAPRPLDSRPASDGRSAGCARSPRAGGRRRGPAGVRKALSPVALPDGAADLEHATPVPSAIAPFEEEFRQAAVRAPPDIPWRGPALGRPRRSASTSSLTSARPPLGGRASGGGCAIGHVAGRSARSSASPTSTQPHCWRGSHARRVPGRGSCACRPRDLSTSFAKGDHDERGTAAARHDPLPRAAGTGEPIVLVHGLLTNGELWREVIPRLAADFRVIAPDWPLGSTASARRRADLSPPGSPS